MPSYKQQHTDIFICLDTR